MRNDALANLADAYAWTLMAQRIPYIWGGDSPWGADCSGEVILVLQSVGLFPYKQDTTADGLWHKYQRTESPAKGCLVFYGTGTASHVGWVTDVIGTQVYQIEAGGGGSKNTTVEQAIKDRAYVRLSPVSRRTDVLGYCDPFQT